MGARQQQRPQRQRQPQSMSNLASVLIHSAPTLPLVSGRGGDTQGGHGWPRSQAELPQPGCLASLPPALTHPFPSAPATVCRRARYALQQQRRMVQLGCPLVSPPGRLLHRLPAGPPHLAVGALPRPPPGCLDAPAGRGGGWAAAIAACRLASANYCPPALLAPRPLPALLLLLLMRAGKATRRGAPMAVRCQSGCRSTACGKRCVGPRLEPPANQRSPPTRTRLLARPARPAVAPGA